MRASRGELTALSAGTDAKRSASTAVSTEDPSSVFGSKSSEESSTFLSVTSKRSGTSREFSASIRSREFSVGDRSHEFSVSGRTARTDIRSNPEFPSLVKRSKKLFVESAMKSLTINKLQFKEDGLYGHSEAKSRLDACLESNGKQIVLISGESGVGKTSLAGVIRKRPKFTVVSGTFFDCQSRNGEPYSAIAEAVSELCGKILALSSDPETVEGFLEMCEKLVTELEDELAVLSVIFPILEEITGQSYTTSNQSIAVSEERKNRFNYAFVRFIRIIATQFGGLAFILDDLQWADQASLDLLESLVTDKEGPVLTIVGTYRCEAVNEEHGLTKSIASWKEQKDSCGFNVTEITVGNLAVSDIMEMLCDVLKRDDEAR